MILDGKSRLRLRIAGKNLLRTYPQLTGNACIVSEEVRDQGRFDTALLERQSPFSIDAPAKSAKPADFEGYFPGANLDKNGVVMVGTKVAQRSVLAATLAQTQPIVAIAKQRDEALVTNVEIKDFNKGKVVTIDLLIQRKLAVGDVLNDNHGHTLVVAGFSAKGCFSFGTDILVHPDADILKGLPVPDSDGPAFRAVKLTKITRRMEDKLAGRSTGRYSLVTQQPLSEHPNPGQKVNIQKFAHLGYVQNAVEMAMVKSSGIRARATAYEALLLRNPVPALETPPTHSAHRLATLMVGCGFSTKVEDGALHIMRITDAQIVKQSHGEVKRPETISYKTLKPEHEGLFCEAIFGNGRDLKCSCGRLEGIRHKGITCMKCGVQVDTHLAPNSRFGHIKLAIPVVHPWLKLQCAQTIAQVGIGDIEGILAVIDYKRSIVDDDDDAEPSDWGVAALESVCMERGVDISRFLIRNLPVLPTNLRPMVRYDAKTFATSDLNDLYRRIIGRNNRVSRLMEMGAPEIIIRNECQMVQEAVETLMRNTTLQGSFGRLLQSIDMEIDNAARDFYERRVDYSATAVCVPDPSLQKKMLGIPTTIATELLKPIIMSTIVADGRAMTVKEAGVLLEGGVLEPYILEMMSAYMDHHMVLATYSDIYVPMRMHLSRREDWGEAIRLNPSDASAFGISFGGEHLAIHLPLCEEAQQELKESPVPSKERYTASLTSLTCEKIAACALSDTPFLLGSLDNLVFSLS
ncbi:hypothetical protein HYW94_00850 [Candidatus Uhrbacteria bacterium]|nr:hypothetical protein [Candidatus Uhrbacteria bacterium]